MGKNKFYVLSFSIIQKLFTLNFKHFITSVFFCCLLLLSIHSKAQHSKTNLQEHDYQRYHFGFFVAANQMDFSIKTNRSLIGATYNTAEYSDFTAYNQVTFLGVESEATPGFTVGIIGNLKLHKYFDLRVIPSLSFGERILNYSVEGTGTGGTEIINVKKNIVSTHVDVPVHIKYKSKRWNNYRAYVLSGVKFSFDMAANSDKNKQQNEDLIRLKTSDILFEAGVGFDYYFDFFKFALEIKMSYGLNNILATSGNLFSDGIESIHNKNFQISITFE